LKFNILYVDPPWRYKKPQTGGSLKSGASQQYSTLSFEDLKNLPINKITEKDCILFLWTTNPFIKEGLELLESWGFEYKTMLTWIKNNYGLGYYFRGKTEHLLLGIKGKVKAFRSNRTNIIQSNKIFKHSEKPEEARKIIDELNVIKNPKKLEIFARKDSYCFIDDKSDWTFIGNEIDKKDVIQSIEILAAAKKLN
jgi:N6-adenosine-specific RNA methylase IME4